MTDLAALDRAAVFAYETQLSRTLADPDRLREVHGAQFKAQSVRDRLDTLCTVACSVLHADGSSIQLITDIEHISVGSSEDPRATTSGPVEESVCKYTVNENALFSVESLTRHALLCENKQITKWGVRAYLGMPVVVHDYAVGAFCVYMNSEREWQPADVTLLTTLAGLAADTLTW